MRAWILMFAIAGCATSTELGLLQHRPGDGTGGSLTGHWSAGAVTDRVLAVGVDVRGDLASSGDRLAFGGSVLAGLPVGRYKVLARAGLWHAVLSNAAERSLAPSFELAGYVPLNDHRDPAHPERGASTAGVAFGVREDLDQAAYTTVFVGIALFMKPGYCPRDTAIGRRVARGPVVWQSTDACRTYARADEPTHHDPRPGSAT